MNELKNRLEEVMRELSIESSADLAKFCKVSEGLVSQWFSGMTKLGPKPLKAFSRTKFSLDWLVDGRLPKYRDGKKEIADLDSPQLDMAPTPVKDERPSQMQWVSDTEGEILSLYRTTDEAGQSRIRKIAKSTPRLLLRSIGNDKS